MRLSNPTALGAVLLAVMSVPACVVPAGAVRQSEGAGTAAEATVTVSMFSGRTDPTFRLTPQQTEALRDCLASDEPVGASRPFDGLGFRYFEVEGVGERKVLVAKNGAWTADGKPTRSARRRTACCVPQRRQHFPKTLSRTSRRFEPDLPGSHHQCHKVAQARAASTDCQQSRCGGRPSPAVTE